MDGWRDESECVCAFLCMHLYAFVEGAPVLALLVLHKTVVTDDDTLSVFLPKTAQHNLPWCSRLWNNPGLIAVCKSASP